MLEAPSTRLTPAIGESKVRIALLKGSRRAALYALGPAVQALAQPMQGVLVAADLRGWVAEAADVGIANGGFSWARQGGGMGLVIILSFSTAISRTGYLTG